MDKYTRLLASIDLFKCFNEEDFQSIFKNNLDINNSLILYKEKRI